MAVKTGKDLDIYSSVCLDQPLKVDVGILAPLHTTQSLILLSVQLHQIFFFSILFPFLVCFFPFCQPTWEVIYCVVLDEVVLNNRNR